MKLLFIRHAIAIERDEHIGDDLYRPLSDDGKIKAEKIFKVYKNIYKNIDIIISSNAIRAIQTALILNSYFNSKLTQNNLLNPDTNFDNFKKMINEYKDKNFKTIAIIGHEPDFSEIISNIISDGFVNINIKKASLIEIEFDINSIKGELLNFITPKMILLLNKY